MYRRWVREGVEYEMSGVSDGCFIKGLKSQAEPYSKSRVKPLTDFIEKQYNQNFVF